MDYLDLARESITRHEGVRLKPYRCPTGHLTIGVGRNLDANGIRPDEAELMLRNDIRQAEADVRRLVPGFDSLTANRKAALIDMAFNLGYPRLAQFKNTLAAINRGDFKGAAAGMLDSLWARQVGRRAHTLARMMETG